MGTGVEGSSEEGVERRDSCSQERGMGIGEACWLKGGVIGLSTLMGVGEE